MPTDALTVPVTSFIDELTPVLTGLSRDVAGVKVERLGHDVTVEALNLVTAVIDADGLHTDEELWALITTFAPRLDTQLVYARPADVRKAGMVTGKRSWLEKPSVLFDILVKADVTRGTSHARTYYRAAMEIAHTVCAVDAVPSSTELQKVEAFRSMLLAAIESASAGQVAPGIGTNSAFTPDVTTAGAQTKELPPPRPIEELLAELDALIGLTAVKAEVKLVANLIQVQNIRKARGLPLVESSRHLVFTGNPGTGKTTVGRLLAQIFRTLGVVENGHLVETDRAGLVAGFVGQTALKVTAAFDRAMGGVLLIDEAYALARGDERDFGQEAIDTIVKLVEDRRDDLVVIAAGYPEEMHDFVESNPGLRSRFPKTIQFPDYTDEELVSIFESLCEKSSYSCTAAARKRLLAWFAGQPRDKGFGNGRLARNRFEAAVAHQASRIVAMKDPTNQQLMTLTAEDVAA